MGDSTNPVIKVINGAARFLIGFPSLVVVGLGAFVRGTIGNLVNAAKGLVGLVATGCALLTHALDWGRVKIIRGVNSVISRVPKDPANTDVTKQFFEKSWAYTKSRYNAFGKSSYEKVFSGKQDEKYKEQLSKVSSKPETSDASKETDGLLTNNKKSFKDLIPNTSDVIAKLSQLTIGMSKTERNNADTKRLQNKVNSHNK